MCRYRSGVALLTVLALYARVALSEVVDSEVVQLERIVHLKTFCFDQSLASTFGRERLPGEPEVQDDENAASFTFSYTGANTTGLAHAQEWVRVPLPVPVCAPDQSVARCVCRCACTPTSVEVRHTSNPRRLAPSYAAKAF